MAIVIPLVVISFTALSTRVNAATVAKESTNTYRRYNRYEHRLKQHEDMIESKFSTKSDSAGFKSGAHHPDRKAYFAAIRTENAREGNKHRAQLEGTHIKRTAEDRKLRGVAFSKIKQAKDMRERRFADRARNGSLVESILAGESTKSTTDTIAFDSTDTESSDGSEARAAHIAEEVTARDSEKYFWVTSLWCLKYFYFEICTVLADDKDIKLCKSVLN